MSRNSEITVAQAIAEATAQCLEQDPAVYLMGLGAADPKGIFGTTTGLAKQFPGRVLEMPVAENGMTGIAIGSAITGMRPIMTHQRVDFALMCVEQLVNNAAKWHYMFGGAMSVPLTVRMIIGRGWGQGPQHSQNLQALFMHIPGLKVVMPFSPFDAKGLLVSSVEENNPVIYVEHRWLHSIKGNAPVEYYRVPLGKATSVRQGKDITFISVSYMLIECLKAAEKLSDIGISAEVVDLRTIKPLDKEYIIAAAKRTGKVIVVDSGYLTGGLAAEISTMIYEECFSLLEAPVIRITLPDCPEPTSRALVNHYYPTANTIIEHALKLMHVQLTTSEKNDIFQVEQLPCDVPDSTFCGPF